MSLSYVYPHMYRESDACAGFEQNSSAGTEDDVKN
jgi:hypothetical protein